MSNGPGRGRATVDIELRLIAAIGAQSHGEHPSVLARASLLLGVEHHGASAVAEQDAGAAVGPIPNSRKSLRTDHQRAPKRTSSHERFFSRQAINEARTHGLQVKRGSVGNAE